MRSHADDYEVFESIFSYAKSDEDNIEFSKLNDLIDAFAFYPLYVKKNKNESGKLYSILHSGKDQNSSTFKLYDD